jgi:DNA-binding XRE family transcriptional regulator
MSYCIRTLAIEPVAPVGYCLILVHCGCTRGCPNLRQVQYPVPPTEAATAGMAFRTHRAGLGLPKRDAAARLGITREQLEALERGLARCDWARARAALRFQQRAEA